MFGFFHKKIDCYRQKHKDKHKHKYNFFHHKQTPTIVEVPQRPIIYPIEIPQNIPRQEKYGLGDRERDSDFWKDYDTSFDHVFDLAIR